MLKPIAIATAVSGTLDILFAMILTVFFGREIGNMLRYVGSGPFPPALDMGTGGAILGLLVHFSLMAIMAAALMLFVRQRPRLLDRPVILGVVYGIITYAVMNLIVVPLRFDAPLPPSALSIATQLFAHIVLVGIPMALIAARTLKPAPSS
jgi:membrane associated rhomboid family serine protease